MKKTSIILVAILAAAFGVAHAGGSGSNVSASSTSITGAAVSVSGTGTGVAGAFDKSGAAASSESLSYGHFTVSKDAAFAHSFGGSFAYGTHTGPGTTNAAAFEISHGEAEAGRKHTQSWGRGFEYGNRD